MPDKKDLQNKIGELIFSETGYLSDEKIDRDREVEQIQKSIGVDQRKSILLDSACGTGLHGLMLTKKGYSVIGVDISRKMTKIAHKRRTAKGENFLVILGDLESLPLRSKIVDLCYAAYILHHFPDVRNVLKELSNVTKIRGRFFIVDPNGKNPITKLSNLLFDVFFKRIQKNLRAPSERAKEAELLKKLLVTFGYTDINIRYLFICGPLHLPARSVIGFLTFVKRILYTLAWKMLPKCYGATDMIMTARKSNIV
jgi:ubiquinone/menaquinone biosynthesis C-methylase UbiE